MSPGDLVEGRWTGIEMKTRTERSVVNLNLFQSFRCLSPWYGNELRSRAPSLSLRVNMSISLPIRLTERFNQNGTLRHGKMGSWK